MIKMVIENFHLRNWLAEIKEAQRRIDEISNRKYVAYVCICAMIGSERVNRPFYIFLIFFFFFDILVARFLSHHKKKSKYISGEKCYATRGCMWENTRGRSRRERKRWKETVISVHAMRHGVYLHAKVHFVQVYNYGFPGRQVPVP